MYRLDHAPTATILREIQLRLDAMCGCVLPGYDVEELVRELRDRADGTSSAPAGLSLERIASLYGRILRAKYNIRGMAEMDRWTPVSLSAVTAGAPTDRAEHAPAGDFGSGRDRLEDPAARATSEAQLRDAVAAIYRQTGLRGARAFVDWFEGQLVDVETGLPVSDSVVLVEIEPDSDDPAPERAWLWYRGSDGLERSVRAGTVRRWLKAAHDASRAASDGESHPKPVLYNGSRVMRHEGPMRTLALLPKHADADRYAATVRTICRHFAANDSVYRLPQSPATVASVRWIRDERSGRLPRRAVG